VFFYEQAVNLLFHFSIFNLGGTTTVPVIVKVRSLLRVVKKVTTPT
jgi:hypothetical protein